MQGVGAGSDADAATQGLYERLRKIWDDALTVPAMKDRVGKIAGYLVTLEEGKDGIREFLLVPYFGACIHTPPPPPYQIIHVKASPPVKNLKTMDPVWVSGRFALQRTGSDMGASGYLMAAEKVTKYEEPVGKRQ